MSGLRRLLTGAFLLARDLFSWTMTSPFYSIDGLKSAALQNPALLALLISHQQSRIRSGSGDSRRLVLRHTYPHPSLPMAAACEGTGGLPTLNFTQECLSEMRGACDQAECCSSYSTGCRFNQMLWREIRILDAEALLGMASVRARTRRAYQWLGIFRSVHDLTSRVERFREGSATIATVMEAIALREGDYSVCFWAAGGTGTALVRSADGMISGGDAYIAYNGD